MSCNFYEKYGTGKIGEDDFLLHVKVCPECQSEMEADKQLVDIAYSLKEEVDTAELWDKIELDLRAEKNNTTAHKINNPLKWTLRIAAIFIIGVVITWQMVTRSDIGNEDLLTTTVLKKVEKIEAQYEKAIRKLEEKSAHNLQQMDLELALLYRDRLETIDVQIARCREALDENPGNSHIRRFMLAALQDKKQTLKEVLALDV